MHMHTWKSLEKDFRNNSSQIPLFTQKNWAWNHRNTITDNKTTSGIYVCFIVDITILKEFIVVLICISLIGGDVEHLFHLPIGYPDVFLEKCLFNSFDHFLVGSFLSFCYLGIGIPHIFSILYEELPFQIHGLKIFSPILLVAFLFCFWIPLLCRRFLIWCSPTCLFLLLLSK